MRIKSGCSFVKIDEAEALAPAHELRTVILIIGGVCTIIIIAIELILSRSIANPLVGVAGKLKTMSHGMLQQDQVVIKISDEIGELGQVFNEMLGGLQNFLKYAGDILEGKVEKENFGQQGDFEASLQQMLSQAKEKIENGKKIREQEELQKFQEAEQEERDRKLAAEQTERDRLQAEKERQEVTVSGSDSIGQLVQGLDKFFSRLRTGIGGIGKCCSGRTHGYKYYHVRQC